MLLVTAPHTIAYFIDTDPIPNSRKQTVAAFGVCQGSWP